MDFNYDFGEIDTSSWDGFLDSFNKYLTTEQKATAELDTKHPITELKKLIARNAELAAELESEHNRILTTILSNSGVEYEATESVEGEPPAIPTLDEIQAKRQETKDEVLALNEEVKKKKEIRDQCNNEIQTLDSELKRITQEVEALKKTHDEESRRNKQRASRICFKMHNNNPIAFLVNKEGYIEEMIGNKENNPKQIDPTTGLPDKEAFWQALNEQFGIQ